jgi:hypothetical protein
MFFFSFKSSHGQFGRGHGQHHARDGHFKLRKSVLNFDGKRRRDLFMVK